MSYLSMWLLVIFAILVTGFFIYASVREYKIQKNRVARDKRTVEESRNKKEIVYVLSRDTYHILYG